MGEVEFSRQREEAKQAKEAAKNERAHKRRERSAEKRKATDSLNRGRSEKATKTSDM